MSTGFRLKVAHYIHVKFLLYLCLFLFTVVNQGRSFVITERVGEEIDFEEAKSYKLFQNVKDFKYAKFERVDIGKYNLLIIFETDSLRIPLKAEPILTLKDYLTNFAYIENSEKERQNFEERNNIVSYDIFGLPITGEEVKEAMSGRERLGCILGGSTLGLFISSILGWSYAVDYVGQEHVQCLGTHTYNIYQVNQPLFFTYSVAGCATGASIGYYTGAKWDLTEAMNKASRRGFAYFNDNITISEQEVKNSLKQYSRPTCFAIGVPLSLLAGGAALFFSYYLGMSIRNINFEDKLMGEEAPTIISISIGIATTATLIDYFIKNDKERNRKDVINRIKEEKLKLLKERQ